MVRHPVTVSAACENTILIGLPCSVVILISLIPIYLGEAPYNFTIAQQGLVFVSPCVGNLIGAYCCGYLNDRLSRFSARHNNGVFEPEMRLPVVLIPALFAPAGCLMFGIGIANETHWIVPVIGVGLVGVTLTGIPSLAQPYLMDAYHPIALDILVVGSPCMSRDGRNSTEADETPDSGVQWLQKCGILRDCIRRHPVDRERWAYRRVYCPVRSGSGH
jgi:MFS family permease